MAALVSTLWVLSFAPFIPHGSLFWAIVLCSAFVFFEILTYAALVSVMPRAGGDYVWQSRILSGGTAFVLAATGWWFILWHWVPIYANATVISVFQPLLKIIGADSVATWFTGKNGIFVSSVIVVMLTWAYISLGMRGYARFQRISFFAGAIGFGIFVILMLVNSKTGFIHAFNREAHNLYGTSGDAYHATIKKSGYGAPGPLHFDVGATFSMIGFMAFFLLWPNWGATLAGEVRGANDLKKNVKAMSAGLLLSAGAALIFIGLFVKTFGWDFYTAANNGYGSGTACWAPIRTR